MNRVSEWFHSGPISDSNDEQQLIRERILTVVLIGAALLGAISYFGIIRISIQQDAWIWAVIFTTTFIWFCAIAFIRRIPYTVRAFSILIIFYSLGIISAMQYGPIGDCRIWFLGASFLAGILMGFRVGIGSIVISTITYLGLGWSMQNGLLPVPEPSGTLHPIIIQEWTFSTIPFLIISTIIVTSISILIQGLIKNIQRSHKLTEELAFDQQQLKTLSQTLERRELQVRTAAEISRTVIAELDPDILLQRVVNLLLSRFNLYYVGVFTVDPSGHYAVLRAGTGDAGEKMLADKHQLAIGTTSMIGYAISQKEPRIASDISLEPYHFTNPNLPHTRSELALPMITADRVLGAITVQSLVANAFDEDDIVVYQGVADSLATALVNANLYQQVQSSLEEIHTLHRQYLLESWGNVTSRMGKLSYTYEKESHPSDGITNTILPPIAQNLPLLVRDVTIGNISIEADRSILTPQEQAFVEAVTQQTAQALENIRLVEETQRTAHQDRIVNSISEELSRAMDVESVIKTAVREIGRLPNITDVSVHIEPFADDN